MGAFVTAQLVNFESPVGSGALGEYDPSFRIGDGWLQDFRKGPGTVIGEKPGHGSMAPGIVTACTLLGSIAGIPTLSRNSALSAAGAHPAPLMA